MTERPSVGRPRDPEVDARILEATRVLLEEGGLAAVTIAAVAERAQVTRPAVYRRFPDAETLAIGVLLDELDRRVVKAVPHVPADLDLLDQFTELVRPIFSYYLANLEVSRALLQLALFSQCEARVELEAQLMGFLGEVATRVIRAMERGELPPDAPVKPLVESFFALYLVTAIGGVRGLLPTLEAMVEQFRTTMRLQLRGAGWKPGVEGG